MSPPNMPTQKQIVIPHPELQEFVIQIFLYYGLSKEDAETAAHALVKANLRGVDSHGIARVPMYCERLRRRVANPRPDIKIKRVAPAAALIDGDDGLGLIVGKRGMAEAISIAHELGIGLAGVKRSGHYGMAALYVLQASQAGFIGLAFTNASPALPVWGGREPFLGTSPLAFGIPMTNGRAVVIDMACSITARGRLKFAAQRGEPIREGLALDKNGRPTTDGQAAYEGVVLPFGGVKGAALSMLMDILGGVFTGAAFGGEVRNPFTGLDGPQGTGHLFGAVRADLFMPIDVFLRRMNVLSTRIKAQPLAEGFAEIMTPGEPEDRVEAERLVKGIPVTADVVEALKAEAELVGTRFPFSEDGVHHGAAPST